MSSGGCPIFEHVTGDSRLSSPLGTRDRKESTVSTARVRILVGMLSASVLINVGLAHRLPPGTDVPSFRAVDLRGQPRTIVYNNESKPTVLYVLTPACSWCARNMDNFKALVDQENSQYRFIAVSLSRHGLAEYVAKNDLNLPVYTDLSAETQKAYKLGGTPQTIVVSPEGRLLQNWGGAYVGDQKAQVEAFFNIKLPGLKELPEAKAAKN